MRVGVAVTHVEGDEAVLVDGHGSYPLASVAKLPVLIAVARALQAQDIRLEQTLTLRDEDKIIGSGQLRFRPAGAALTVREAIELMNTISDNTASDMLFNLVGVDSVNAMMREYGLHESDIYLTNRGSRLLAMWMHKANKGRSAARVLDRWRDLKPEERRRMAAEILASDPRSSLAEFERADKASSTREGCQLAAAFDNQSSPSDVAHLLTKLHQGQLLDPDWTSYVMDVLARHEFNSRIPRHLPPGTRTWHKTGSFKGLVNDAGIIEINPSSHVVVVVLCHDVARWRRDLAKELIGRITRAAFDHFSTVSVQSE